MSFVRWATKNCITKYGRFQRRGEGFTLPARSFTGRRGGAGLYRIREIEFLGRFGIARSGRSRPDHQLRRPNTAIRERPLLNRAIGGSGSMRDVRKPDPPELGTRSPRPSFRSRRTNFFVRLLSLNNLFASD